MDEKCQKNLVFTAETAFEASAEVPIDIDFNLPDYCPEISRILKCRAKALISSKRADGKSISVDGVFTATVIYCDPENVINSYEYRYPFSKTFESGGDISGDCVSSNAKCGYLNCRAQSERKIDVHASVLLTVHATAQKSREIICDVSDRDIEALRLCVPVTMPAACAEKYVLIEEELELGNSQPDIDGIIKYDASIGVSECKLLENKAIVKGNMAVNLLYRDTGGEIVPFSAEIPFSQLMEAEGATETNECETTADTAYLEIKPKQSGERDTRGFSLDAKILISLTAYCDSEINVISDAYSKKYALSTKSEETDLLRSVCFINDSFTFTGEIDPSPASVVGVLGVWCDADAYTTVFDGDCMTVSGTALAGVLALDDNGAPAYIEKPVEFEYSYKLPSTGENLCAKPVINVTSVSYTLLSGGKMEITAKAEISAAVMSNRRISVICGMETDESKPADRNDAAALTVYFADEGESLWQIARKYLSSIDEIRKINGINDDILKAGQMILVPA